MEASLWCYAWDFAAGPDAFLGWAASSGLTQLNVAGTYHAGWFLHPHASNHRAYMAEDGVCYFQPQMDLYAETRLKPRVAQICSETDWMAVGTEAAAGYGLKIASWTIGCHNTRLGLEHPECASRNCFDDVYPHALCPAHPEVQIYLRALCADLSNNLTLHAIQPETFGYSGWRHGHHHERDLTGLSDVEAKLMNLCFHPATMESAGAAGIDAEKLQTEVRALLEGAFQFAPDRPSAHPSTWEEVCAQLPDLASYQLVCERVEETVLTFVAEGMRRDAEIQMLGRYRKGLEERVAAFSCSVYGQSPEQVLSSVTTARKSVPDSKKLHVGIRLGMGVPNSQLQLQEIVAAAEQGGADLVMFYNSSESPRRMLSWIKPSLEAMRA